MREARWKAQQLVFTIDQLQEVAKELWLHFPADAFACHGIVGSPWNWVPDPLPVDSFKGWGFSRVPRCSVATLIAIFKRSIHL